MADLRTEEEQIDAIKQWWKDNGRSTVLGVVLAATAVFGWRTWQDYQAAHAENASLLYQNLNATVQVQPGETLGAERKSEAVDIATQLKTEFGNSTYAQFAALWLAKAAVESGELAVAKAELEWMLGQQPDAQLQQLARLRLARVLMAQQDYTAALAALGAAPLNGFESSYYETKGDILLLQERPDQARAAYQQGVDRAGDTPNPILTMKLEDLSVAADS